MKHNALKYLEEYLSEVDRANLDDIRGGNKTYFTRKRKIELKNIFLQMLGNRGLSQKKEIIDLYKGLRTDVSFSAIVFYKARMKVSPKVISKMEQDYISDIYYHEKEYLKKLKGYYIMAVDGSDIVLPTSIENEQIFGKNAHAIYSQ